MKQTDFKLSTLLAICAAMWIGAYVSHLKTENMAYHALIGGYVEAVSMGTR